MGHPCFMRGCGCTTKARPCWWELKYLSFNPWETGTRSHTWTQTIFPLRSRVYPRPPALPASQHLVREQEQEREGWVCWSSLTNEVGLDISLEWRHKGHRESTGRALGDYSRKEASMQELLCVRHCAECAHYLQESSQPPFEAVRMILIDSDHGCVRHCSLHLPVLTHLMLTMTLWEKYLYYSSDGETEVQRELAN